MEITVEGEPKSKGSVSAFPIKRKDGTTGVVVVHSRKSKDWEFLIRVALEGCEFVAGPVAVEMIFYLLRPASVKREFPSVKPDIDKLVRAVLDALRELAIEDDARVVDLVARKRYVAPGQKPGVWLKVTPVQAE